ncbi:hypothetical protein NL676_010676 [Syzygium grande]|nr:hypothetical protein NL676_010676 [Syzygium grande]
MEFASEIKHESLSKISRNDGHGEHSPYFDGWKAYDQNPFHPTQNPYGVIQMGLAENQLCFNQIEEWMKDNPTAFICTSNGIGKFKDVAIFLDYDGLLEFRQPEMEHKDGKGIQPMRRFFLEVKLHRLVSVSPLKVISSGFDGFVKITPFTLMLASTQHLLASMLYADEMFVENFLEERRRLAKSQSHFVKGLEQDLEDKAGLFLWMDLGHLVKEPTLGAEMKL